MTEDAGRVIGFVGLGNMGLPMSRRLVAAGYRVRGFDLADAAVAAFTAPPVDQAGQAQAGPGEAVAVTTATAAGDGADAVILMLPDSDSVEGVLLGGVLDSLPQGGVVIDMSSSDPVRTLALAERAAAAGVTLIDAPVSGGVRGAVAGTLTIMVGGPDGLFERFRPLLAALGARIVHAGPTGAGHAVKALNNLMSAAHLLASSEALIAGQRFGLDPAVMLEIVNTSSGRSWSTENKWPNFVLTGRYDAGFPLRLMVKDVRLALGIEHATGVPAAAGEAVAAVWEAALADLPPDADHTAIARWLSERAAAG